eukprot:TRINITY_DN3467_c0_g1_i2.p1 TRINITY_DN3467_c0_g1~~TRINITY_DN3467_c0_g1_i2.p1  ORF type:complete len:503 (+),score=95.23 TRINITY_DN3467_c0_g1_i2:40-1548(+)
MENNLKFDLTDLVSKLDLLGKEQPTWLYCLTQVVQPTIEDHYRVPLLQKLFEEVPNLLSSTPPTQIEELVQNPPIEAVAFRLLLDLRQIQSILQDITPKQLLIITAGFSASIPPQQLLSYLKKLQDLVFTWNMQKLCSLSDLVKGTRVNMERATIMQAEPNLSSDICGLVIKLLQLDLETELKPFYSWIQNLSHPHLILLVNLLQLDSQILIELRGRLVNPKVIAQKSGKRARSEEDNYLSQPSKVARQDNQGFPVESFPPLPTFEDNALFTDFFQEEPFLNFDDMSKLSLRMSGEYNFDNSMSLSSSQHLNPLTHQPNEEMMFAGENSTMSQETEVSYGTPNVSTSNVTSPVRSPNPYTSPQPMVTDAYHHHQSSMPLVPMINISHQIPVLGITPPISSPVPLTPQIPSSPNSAQVSVNNKKSRANPTPTTPTTSTPSVVPHQNVNIPPVPSPNPMLPNMGSVFHLIVNKQPPAQTVYQRILKPFPAVQLIGKPRQVQTPS